MGFSECEHGFQEDPDHPCLACVLVAIHEHAVSRDGSPEQDETNLLTIREICENTLKQIGFPIDVEEVEEDGDDDEDAAEDE